MRVGHGDGNWLIARYNQTTAKKCGSAKFKRLGDFGGKLTEICA